MMSTRPITPFTFESSRHVRGDVETEFTGNRRSMSFAPCGYRCHARLLALIDGLMYWILVYRSQKYRTCRREVVGDMGNLDPPPVPLGVFYSPIRQP